jgi:two-component sensor histidine kinase
MPSPVETGRLSDLEDLRGQLLELQGRHKALCALLECERALGESLDLDQVQRTIVHQASFISGAVGVRLFLVDNGRPNFRCCNGDTLTPDDVQTLEFLMSQGIPGPRIEDGSSAANDALPGGPALMVHLGHSSCLGLPLALADRLLGILAIPIPSSRSYTAEELSLFDAFARRAVVALKHARQHAATREELAECRRREASIQHTLAERDVLLREVHHRVKNNLQVVASLLELKAGALQDSSTRQAVREIKDRVQSMARIHEHLFKSPDAGRITMDKYLRHLATALHQTSNAEDIGLSLHVGAVPLDIDQAISCGLIVNELVGNAFKHAFPDGRVGEVVVAMEDRDGQYVLTVRDTGVGLPPHLDPQSAGSLGLRLVGLLAKQLGGMLHLASEEGVTARITFPAHPLDRDAA